MYGKQQRTLDEQRIKKGIIAGVVLVIAMIISFTTFYIVPAGHRGVLLTFGKPSMDAKSEGLGIKFPIAQSVVKMEVRTQKIEVTADSASLDLQDVQTIIALNFHLSEESVPRLYQEIGLDYTNRIINPAIEEAVKAVTATYRAEELITKRPRVREDMKEVIKEKLTKYYLVIDDFNIVDFKFSEEFDKAIEQKVTAEQLKLKAERDLERIQVEAQQKEAEAIGFKKANIAQAEGEARAIEIIESQLTKSPKYIEWYKVNKWNGILPQVTAGMPFIDVTPVPQ